MQTYNKYERSIYSFNIIYLFFTALWPLFQGNFFNGIDGAGRMGWIMMLFAIIFNGRTLLNVPKVMLLWGVWIIYNIILSQIKGFHSENISFTVWTINSLIKPFITMLVAYHAFRMDFHRTLKWIFYCWLIFVVIGLLTMQGNTRDVMGEDVIRQNNEMGNTYINASIFLLTFAFCLYYKGQLGKSFFVFVCLIEIAVIVLSGSRKALLSIFIIFFSANIGKDFKMNKKKLLRICFIFVIAYIVIQLIMTYTVAGLRIQAGFETTKYEDSWFLSMMGDRGWMYYYGWEMFLDNSLTGIGLLNFRLQNPLGIPLVLHTEYMVQICECGIIGSSLFLSFYLGMFRRIIQSLRDSYNKQISFVILAAMLGFLMMSFFTWTYTSVYYFIFFGFVYAIYDNKNC